MTGNDFVTTLCWFLIGAFAALIVTKNLPPRKENEMAIYKMTVRGEDKVRLVRAATAAQARDHIVSADAINAEELADLLASGAKLETAGEVVVDPTKNEGSPGDDPAPDVNDPPPTLDALTMTGKVPRTVVTK